MAILGAGVLAEAARLVEPWPGFEPTASRVVSIFLMVLWGVTVAGVVGRRRQRWVAKRAWAFALAAPLSMFIHAAVTRVGGSWLGLAYVVAAVVLAFALKRAFVGRHSPLVRGARIGDPIRR